MPFVPIECSEKSKPSAALAAVHDVALAADIGVARDDQSGRVGQHHGHRDVGEAVLEPVQDRHRRPTQHRDGLVRFPVVDVVGRDGHLLADAPPPALLDVLRYAAATGRLGQQPATHEHLPAAPGQFSLGR